MSQRMQLSFAKVLTDKTHAIRIRHRGAYIKLGVAPATSVLAFCATPTGTFVVPTVSIPTQAGDDFGLLRIVYDATAFTAALAGWWLLDIDIGASGDEEPIERRYTFELQEKETAA